MKKKSLLEKLVAVRFQITFYLQKRTLNKGLRLFKFIIFSGLQAQYIRVFVI